MTTAPTTSRLRRFALPAVAALAMAAAGAAVPAASASTKLSGPTTFTFTGAAFEKQGIKADARGRAKEAETGELTRYVTPTTSGVFGSKTTKVKHAGSIMLERKSGGKTRSIRVSSIQVQLRNKKSNVRAKVGKKRMTFLSLDLRKGDFKVDRAAKAASVPVARATLSKAAAKEIGKALRVKSVRRSSFAVVSVTTHPVGAAPIGGGAAPPAPAPAPPAPGVVSGTLQQLQPLHWNVRNSFINYIASGEGTTVSDGAVGGTPRAGLVYDYYFPPVAAGSWYDMATNTGVFRYSGTLRSSFSERGINMLISDPEVHLQGGSSMLYAKYGGSTVAREFASISVGSIRATGSVPNFTIANLPVFVTGAANIALFNDFYPAPDNDFGTLNVSFTYGS